MAPPPRECRVYALFLEQTGPQDVFGECAKASCQTIRPKRVLCPFVSPLSGWAVWHLSEGGKREYIMPTNQPLKSVQSLPSSKSHRGFSHKYRDIPAAAAAEKPFALALVVVFLTGFRRGLSS